MIRSCSSSLLVVDSGTCGRRLSVGPRHGARRQQRGVEDLVSIISAGAATARSLSALRLPPRSRGSHGESEQAPRTSARTPRSGRLERTRAAQVPFQEVDCQAPPSPTTILYLPPTASRSFTPFAMPHFAFNDIFDWHLSLCQSPEFGKLWIMKISHQQGISEDGMYLQCISGSRAAGGTTSLI